MAIQLIDTIVQRMGYPALHKIDPNTEEEKLKKEEIKSEEVVETHTLAQAAVPAAMIGMYKLTRNMEKATEIYNADIATNWVSQLFGENSNEVVSKVAGYSNVHEDEARHEMEKIIDEIILIARDEIGEDKSGTAFRDFISAQRSQLMVYLPTSLRMGELLNDTTIDDKTHKMEGPMSNLMHKIEKLFSDSDTNKDNA